MEVATSIKDAIVCAIMGELANRSISFLVSKWRNNGMSATEEERLRRLLLRVRAIVEEAEGRHITNMAMLQQLYSLRMEMYRGYHAMDRLSCGGGAPGRGDKLELDDVHQVRHSISLHSHFNTAKRLCVRGGNGSATELQRVLGNLEAAVEDAGPELAKLSGRYPRLFRQPYSAYLLLDRCMFGRQMEMEHVVNFLLQAPDQAPLGVMPIVGPGKVGKSTLVHHACADERVRGHFSRIIFVRADDGDLITLAPDAAAHQRVLIIAELHGDFDDGSWRRLRSASKSRRVALACGSKMIVTSRSDKIASLGTTPALKLNFFTPEAYWYFFKVRTFGSTDVREHPKLASIAMEIARELDGCFVAANIFRGILQSNMDARFWSLTLATFREFRQKNPFLFSAAQPVDSWEQDSPVHVPTPKKSTCPGRYSFVILDNYETDSFHRGDDGAPKVTVQDILYGGARPQGKFDVLASRSHLPPHYYYVFNCEVRAPRRVVTRRKNNHKITCA